MKPGPDAVYYCNMEALTPQQRLRHRELATMLRSLVSGFNELENGYTAVIHSPDNQGSYIEEFMVLEQLCCPFFNLSYDKITESKAGAVLTITGPGDIKPFIRSEFGITENEILP